MVVSQDSRFHKVWHYSKNGGQILKVKNNEKKLNKKEVTE